MYIYKDPETDDDDRDERLVPNTPEAHPGVDGGFFTGEDDDDSATTHPDTIDGGVGKRREPDFGPRLGEDDEGATEMDRRSPRQPGGGGVGGGPRGPSFPGPTDFEQGFNGVSETRIRLRHNKKSIHLRVTFAGWSRRKCLPTKEDVGTGNDGSGTFVGERQPAALCA